MAIGSKQWRKTRNRYLYIQRLLVDLDRTADGYPQSDLRVFTEETARQEFGPKWGDVLDELSRVVFYDAKDRPCPIVTDWIAERGVVAAVVLPRRHLSAIAMTDGFTRFLRIVDIPPRRHVPPLASRAV